MEIDPFFAVENAQATNSVSTKEKPQPSSSPAIPPSSGYPPSSSTDKSTPAAKEEESAPSSNPSKQQPSSSSTTPTSQTTTSSSLVDDANEELAILLHAKKITQHDVTCLQSIIRENVSLREKVAKLKSLLGRSAKAQRETKADLDATKNRLNGAQQEIERLNARVEALASRPTHMDLLADFETNFDRAVLSIGPTSSSSSGREDHQQSGEETSGPPLSSSTQPSASLVPDVSDVTTAGITAATTNTTTTTTTQEQGSVSSSLLLTELSEAKSRVERLESLNSALLHRASHLERTNETLTSEKNTVEAKLANTQLELRMARMETENASREMREKAASLAEMQLEIDLVTKSAMDANARAVEGMEAAERVRTDKEHVAELEAKVVALQEWALASAEAKRLTSERCHLLEDKIREMAEEKEKLENKEGVKPDEGLMTGVGGGGKTDGTERRLWTKSSSLVVGAGLIELYGVELGECLIAANETVLLRWKFDITPSNLDIFFSIYKGRCDDKKKLKGMDLLLKDRHVQGGGGGEISGAFAVQNACTLVWSNTKSWVRPRTIKFAIEAYAIQ